MISRTSRRPPASRFTLGGLRVKSASALSITAPGLPGASGFLDGLPSVLPADGAGISSHFSPPMVSYVFLIYFAIFDVVTSQYSHLARKEVPRIQGLKVYI
jgi:hypothetical protein